MTSHWWGGPGSKKGQVKGSWNGAPSLTTPPPRGLPWQHPATCRGAGREEWEQKKGVGEEGSDRREDREEIQEAGWLQGWEPHEAGEDG